ncbi:MAG: hypothetical protein PUE00_01845, partial [Thermobifida fusca]|nr:hypothetical protein [Thermobifida fusca]
MTGLSTSDPGRLLRPFALALKDSDDTALVLDLASMVVAVHPPEEGYETAPEQEKILRLCAVP